MTLNTRQKKFIAEYIELGLTNANEAARRAGYAAGTSGANLLRSPEVRIAIEQARKELEKNFNYSAYECFKRLQMVQEKALERKKLIRGRQDEPDIEIDYPDLQSFLKAEEMKAKIFGLLKENINHNAKLAVVSMGQIKIEGEPLKLSIGENSDAETFQKMATEKCEQKMLPLYEQLTSRFDDDCTYNHQNIDNDEENIGDTNGTS